MMRAVISKHAGKSLLAAMVGCLVISTTAMAQVEQHSQVSVQGTGLITKDTDSDSNPLTIRLTKSCDARPG